MSYKIGSFNIRQCGIKATLEKLAFICKIIRDEEFDIVALQEITNEEPLKTMKKFLDTTEWDGLFEKPPSSNSEGYAFLWNTRRIELPNIRTEKGTERIFYPRIFNQYRLERQDGQIMLIRNPFYGRFIPKAQPMMEFRIINTHIRFKKKSGRNSDDENDIPLLSDAVMRRHEFNVLTRTIYPKIADKIYGMNEAGKLRAAYTVIIGDYNLNLRRKWTISPYLEEVFEINDNGALKRIQTFQETLTTLKEITEDEKDSNQPKYANNFDHSTYDTLRFSGVSATTRRIDAVRNYDNSNYSHYRKEISDHLPIYLEFENR